MPLMQKQGRHLSHNCSHGSQQQTEAPPHRKLEQPRRCRLAAVGHRKHEDAKDTRPNCKLPPTTAHPDCPRCGPAATDCGPAATDCDYRRSRTRTLHPPRICASRTARRPPALRDAMRALGTSARPPVTQMQRRRLRPPAVGLNIEQRRRASKKARRMSQRQRGSGPRRCSCSGGLCGPATCPHDRARTRR